MSSISATEMVFLRGRPTEPPAQVQCYSLQNLLVVGGNKTAAPSWMMLAAAFLKLRHMLLLHFASVHWQLHPAWPFGHELKTWWPGWIAERQCGGHWHRIL
jgi:hypothetical protein